MDVIDVVRQNRAERRDAVESRRRILQEAHRLFHEHGIESVSMHAIALAAGVGQATLYRRYGNKGDLCFDLMKESTEALKADMLCFLRSATELPALTRLDGVLERMVAFMDVKVQLMAAMRDAYCGEHRALHFANPFYQWFHGCVADLFREAVEHGDVADLDPVFTADALLGALSPHLYEYQRRERGLEPEDILTGLRRLYTTGLY